MRFGKFGAVVNSVNIPEGTGKLNSFFYNIPDLTIFDRLNELTLFCTNNLMEIRRLELVAQALELGFSTIVFAPCHFFSCLVSSWNFTAFTSICMFSGEFLNDFPQLNFTKSQTY